MTPRAKSFPIVERVEEQDLTQPRFWTIQRYPTTDEQFPLVQIVQVRTPYGVVTAWQVWAGPGKWAFHTEAEALTFAAQCPSGLRIGGAHRGRACKTAERTRPCGIS